MGQLELDRDVEATPTTRPNRRRRRRRAPRLRVLYFALAAVWGFVTGTAAILAGLSVLGRPLSLDPRVAGLILAAALLAVVGGLVASAAYQDAVNRHQGRDF